MENMLREIIALLSSIELEASIDHLIYPLADISPEKRNAITTHTAMWLNKVVIKELNNLLQSDVENIYSAINNFYNDDTVLTCNLKLAYSNDNVVLMLVKIRENGVTKILLNNLWLNSENIVMAIINEHTK